VERCEDIEETRLSQEKGHISPSLPVASQLSLSQLIGLQPSFPDRVRCELLLFTHKQFSCTASLFPIDHFAKAIRIEEQNGAFFHLK
jgi:hypothetical protein